MIINCLDISDILLIGTQLINSDTNDANDAILMTSMVRFSMTSKIETIKPLSFI